MRARSVRRRARVRPGRARPARGAVTPAPCRPGGAYPARGRGSSATKAESRGSADAARLQAVGDEDLRTRRAWSAPSTRALPDESIAHVRSAPAATSSSRSCCLPGRATRGRCRSCLRQLPGGVAAPAPRVRSALVAQAWLPPDGHGGPVQPSTCTGELPGRRRAVTVQAVVVPPSTTVCRRLPVCRRSRCPPRTAAPSRRGPDLLGIGSCVGVEPLPELPVAVCTEHHAVPPLRIPQVAAEQQTARPVGRGAHPTGPDAPAGRTRSSRSGPDPSTTRSVRARGQVWKEPASPRPSPRPRSRSWPHRRRAVTELTEGVAPSTQFRRDVDAAGVLVAGGEDIGTRERAAVSLDRRGAGDALPAASRATTGQLLGPFDSPSRCAGGGEVPPTASTARWPTRPGAPGTPRGRRR